MNNDIQIKLNDDGDFYSFNQCFEQIYAGMCVFAVKFVGDTYIAEDIVQDVFIKLWQNFTSFSSDVSIKAFLYQAVRNKCLNYLDHVKVKNQYKLEKHAEYKTEKFFIHEMMEIETHRIIHKAIGELPVKCREIILLSLEGLKNNEIAEQLKISINTVKTQKSIAYKQLREKLGSLYSLIQLLLIG